MAASAFGRKKMFLPIWLNSAQLAVENYLHKSVGNAPFFDTKCDAGRAVT
jgi:hypothetical protein